MKENGLTKPGVCLNSSKPKMMTSTLYRINIRFDVIVGLHLQFQNAIDDKIPSYNRDVMTKGEWDGSSIFYYIIALQ
jgi:hypothetical protein